MVIHLLLSFFCLFTTLYSTSPIAHQGRFRPIDSYSKQWLFNLYNRHEIKNSDLKHFDGKSSEELAWHMHFNGIEPWQQSPLFWIQSTKLKSALGLKIKNSRFSYQQIYQAIYLNEQSNLNLMQQLIPHTFEKAYNDPSNRGKSTHLELKNLTAGLWVNYQNNQLSISAAPTTPLWKFLKPGMVIGTLNHVQALDEGLELIGKLQMFSQPVAPIDNTRPLSERLEMAGSDFKALPYRAKPGHWISLKALKLQITDMNTGTKSYIQNFTLYPDSLFKEIQHAYLEKEIPILKQKLSEGYLTLAGKPFLKAEGKSLRYPTIAQLNAESWLSSFPILMICIVLYSLGVVLALLSQTKTSTAFILLAFVLHTLLLGIRCFILGRPPVSNMFETVIYVPWTAVLAGILLKLYSKNSWILPAASIISILLLTLLEITQLNNSLENVQAVLNSQYWLIIHVLMVVGSYGLFALAAVLGHIYLLTLPFYNQETKGLKSLAKLIIQSMYIGTALLIPGTILGGVWAAQSWGRFWDWDPKESWAFISSCVYLMWIHAYRFHHIQNFGLAIGSIIGLTTISFTWYGVNYILGTGLHSYGFGTGGKIYYYLYLAIEIFFVSIVIFLHRRFRFQK